METTLQVVVKQFGNMIPRKEIAIIPHDSGTSIRQRIFKTVTSSFYQDQK